jgi:uncharacterized membrane protein YccC
MQTETRIEQSGKKLNALVERLPSLHYLAAHSVERILVTLFLGISGFWLGILLQFTTREYAELIHYLRYKRGLTVQVSLADIGARRSFLHKLRQSSQNLF